jgi:CheY-like chemotaxis protein
MTPLSKLILLVEDNPDDVFAVKWCFRRSKISNPIHVVTHGEEAIAYLSGAAPYTDRQRYPLPFMVLLDLKLPYMSGFEVLAWIRERLALEGLVVVALTSSDESKDHQRAYSLGARSYLVKPPEPDGLRDLIDSLQTFWNLRGEGKPVLIGDA